jgi:hypothetical protein
LLPEKNGLFTRSYFENFLYPILYASVRENERAKVFGRLFGEMKVRMSTFEEWIEANPEGVVAAIVAAIIATVLMLWLTNSNNFLNGPSLQVVHVSPPSPVYADGTYSDVQVAVNNGGDVTAEGCSVKAYNHLLFSSGDLDETSVLGESERFSLAPQAGRSATVSVYLPYVSGEALFGGGVRSLLFLRAECSNAISNSDSKKIVLS